MSQGPLRALRFRAAPATGAIRCPKKTTFMRVLHEVDGDLVERVLLRWQGVSGGDPRLPEFDLDSARYRRQVEPRSAPALKPGAIKFGQPESLS